MDLKTKRFLIIDPDLSEVESVLRTLNKNTAPKLASMSASDGFEAIKLINREPFDLILLDITVPKISFQQIRSIALSSKLNRKSHFFLYYLF